MSTVVDVEEAPRPAIDPRLRQRRIEVRREEGRRRLRRLLIAVGVLAALALVWAFTYSSFLDVDHVVVSGQAHTTEAEVRGAANIGRGEPMVYLDAAGAARRVEALPWVASASVHRSYPGTVHVDVVERVPAVAEPLQAGGFRLIDGEGHAIARHARAAFRRAAHDRPDPARGDRRGGRHSAARGDRRGDCAPHSAEAAGRCGHMGCRRLGRARARTAGHDPPRSSDQPSREVPRRDRGARRSSIRTRRSACSTCELPKRRCSRTHERCIGLMTMLDPKGHRPVQRQAQREVDITLDL